MPTSLSQTFFRKIQAWRRTGRFVQTREKAEKAQIELAWTGRVVPALVWDRDYRGLHDRAANTMVINA